MENVCSLKKGICLVIAVLDILYSYYVKSTYAK